MTQPHSKCDTSVNCDGSVSSQLWWLCVFTIAMALCLHNCDGSVSSQLWWLCLHNCDGCVFTIVMALCLHNCDGSVSSQLWWLCLHVTFARYVTSDLSWNHQKIKPATSLHLSPSSLLTLQSSEGICLHFSTECNSLQPKGTLNHSVTFRCCLNSDCLRCKGF